MGATGSYFEKWTSSDSILDQKYTVLEQKVAVLETKYTELQEKQDGLLVKVNNTVSEMLPRLDTVEKRATNMLFQQQEGDCDLVIIH